MKLEKKHYIYIIVGIAVLVLIYFMFFKKNKEEMSEIPDAPSESNDSFPLKKGKYGKRVEQLQMWLLKNHGSQFPKFGIDGKFGDETLSELQKATKRDNVSEEYFNKAGMGNIKTTIYK